MKVPMVNRDINVGDRLLLRVRPPHTSWVFRFTSPAGRRREMGLGKAVVLADGTLPDHQIDEARLKAREAALLLEAGMDPIDHREKVAAAARSGALQADQKQRQEMAKRKHWTLARCARDYHERVIEPTRTPKHAAQWISSLENHIPAELWGKPVSDLTEAELLAAVAGVQAHERARVTSQQLLETKKRIAGRLFVVLSDAVLQQRTEVNAARDLAAHLSRRSPRQIVRHFKSLHYTKAPAFFASLEAIQGVAVDALAFTALTAARTSETLGAEWPEIDFAGRVWRIPAERMKARRPHDVHLSKAAMDVLARARGLSERYVFPSPATADAPLSNMAMLSVLDRLGMRDATTVHGLRAMFSTWANETSAARPEVIEAALAHTPRSDVRAYNRATYIKERAALLDAWAAYLSGAA